MPARKAENKGLPARWSIRRGKYYYEPPKGLEHLWGGKRLFPLGATYQEALRTFADLVPSSSGGGSQTVRDAIDRYLVEVSPRKAARSFQNDVNCAAYLKAVFGEVPLRHPFDVSWAHKHIDTRVHPKTGKPSPVQARKEIALLSAIFTQCVEWGWIRRNELIGQFRRRKAPARSRDVTDEDLVVFKKHAPDWLRAYVDLKALIGIRQADMLRLRESSASEEGVLVEPTKTINSTGRRILFTWTPALRAAWDATLAARPMVRGLAERDRVDNVFQTRGGAPYSADSFSSTWQRVMSKAVEAGLQRFHEHDVRALVASSSATLAEAQARLGHSSPSTTNRVYRRRAERVTPLR